MDRFFRVDLGGSQKGFFFFGPIRFEIPLSVLEEMLRRWWDNEIWGSGEKMGVEIYFRCSQHRYGC